MQVAPGVHRIDTALGTRLSSLYLFVGQDAAVLFDTGVDGTTQRDVLPYLEAKGIGREMLRWVIVSHADVDHFGGLSSAREAFPQAVVGAHSLDAPLISDYSTYRSERARGFVSEWEFDEYEDVIEWTREVTRAGPVDLLLAGGEVLMLGAGECVEILHVPGHTKGHIAIREPRSGVVAISDAVLGEAVPNADGTPAFPPTYRYLDDYLSTIAALRALEPTSLLTAHYGIFTGLAAEDFLTESAGFVDQLDARVRAAIAQSGSAGTTLQGLVDAVGTGFGRWPADRTDKALAFPVVGHIERLLIAGEIERVQGDSAARVRVSVT